MIVAMELSSGNAWSNDWVGRVIGVLTLTPYDFWRHTHALHHAGSGNLGRRGWGDVDTLTVRESGVLPLRPLALSTVQASDCVVRNRAHFSVPVAAALADGLMRGGLRPWVSAMATNVAIAAISALLIWLIGLGPFLLVHLPITLMGASAGVWLFYVQHQFEHTYWRDDQNWNLPDAALHGSSHYELPGILRWFTANIGVHHVHHLCSRIPFYRLPSVLREHPNSPRSVGSPWCRAFPASGSPFGTNRSIGWFRFASALHGTVSA